MADQARVTVVEVGPRDGPQNEPDVLAPEVRAELVKRLATEDLVYLLQGEGIETGVDLDALIAVSEWLEGVSDGASRASSTAQATSRPSVLELTEVSASYNL